MDEGLAVRIAQQVADGCRLGPALARTLKTLRARQGQTGAIALDREGRWAWGTTMPARFAVACTPAGSRSWR